MLAKDPPKVCPKCGVEKPGDDFPRDFYKKSGRFSYCRACVSKRNKEYREKNLERLREYDIERKKHTDHKVMLKIYNKRYLAKEGVKERKKAYLKTDKYREWGKEYARKRRAKLKERKLLEKESTDKC